MSPSHMKRPLEAHFLLALVAKMGTPPPPPPPPVLPPVPALPPQRRQSIGATSAGGRRRSQVHPVVLPQINEDANEETLEKDAPLPTKTPDVFMANMFGTLALKPAAITPERQRSHGPRDLSPQPPGYTDNELPVPSYTSSPASSTEFHHSPLLSSSPSWRHHQHSLDTSSSEAPNTIPLAGSTASNGDYVFHRSSLPLSAQLSRVPFTFLVFLLLYQIVRLNDVATVVHSAATSTKHLVNTSCLVVQTSASITASIPNYIAVGANEVTATTVNKAIDVGLQSAVDGSYLLVSLLESILKFRLRRWLCYADVASEVLVSLVALVSQNDQQVANAQLASFKQSFTQTQNNLRSDLLSSQNSLNSFIGGISSFFTGSAPSIPAMPTFPTVPTLTLTPPNINVIPTPSDFITTLLYEQVISRLLSLTGLQKLEQANQNRSQYYIQSTLLPTPAVVELSFCERIDYSAIDEAATALLMGVYVVIALVAIVILGNLSWNTYWVIYHSPSSANEPSVPTPARRAWSVFVNYVWHLPLIHALVVSICGILVFNMLIFGAQQGRARYDAQAVDAMRAWTVQVVEEYDAAVNASLGEYLRNVDDTLGQAELKINNDLAEATVFLYSIESSIAFIDSELQKLVNIAEEYVDPRIINPVEHLLLCILGLDNLPIGAIHNLTLPLLTVNVPRISPTLFQIGNTSEVTSLLVPIALTVDPLFDGFIVVCQQALQFYYILAAMCVGAVSIAAFYAALTYRDALQHQHTQSPPVGRNGPLSMTDVGAQRGHMPAHAQATSSGGSGTEELKNVRRRASTTATSSQPVVLAADTFSAVEMSEPTNMEVNVETVRVSAEAHRRKKSITAPLKLV